MLNLPANFERDIQGRDTALIPLITIKDVGGGNYADGTEGMSISTNVYNGKDGVVARPILLSIPSLKESIDIEKRNYKISSINIDISNFPHNGKRFSEHFSTQSLINSEVRIFWISPSGYAIFDSPEQNVDSSALMIYFGTIRR